jgi:predicted aspartyl protease
MTTGFFTADGEPALALEVRGLEGSRSVEAVIDTGYNGGLTLPPDWIEAMGLREFGEENVVLADGSLKSIPTYLGYAILEEEAHEVVVAEAPSPLAGTALLWGFSLYVEFEPNGLIEVAPLSDAAS